MNKINSIQASRLILFIKTICIIIMWVKWTRITTKVVSNPINLAQKYVATCSLGCLYVNSNVLAIEKSIVNCDHRVSIPQKLESNYYYFFFFLFSFIFQLPTRSPLTHNYYVFSHACIVFKIYSYL